MATPQDSPETLLEAGTPAFFRANLTMFVGGFATFAMLYGTQPILPLLCEAFGVSAASASLTVSAGTAGLALALIPASLLSDRYGRAPVMKAALVAAALVALASAVVTDFNHLLLLRILLGVALAGLPAAAMAYLGEEVAPAAQGRAFGLYIAGNALGGMSGRFLAALITDWSHWRLALALLGVLGGIAALLFWRQLPASRHFRRRGLALAPILADARAIAGDPGLRALYLAAFLLMGAFVGLYNYLGFRLRAEPFSLGQTAVGAIFLLYLVGTWSSAWAGSLSDRLGRPRVLVIMILLAGAGLAVTLADHLVPVILGLALFTFGYFGAHATASGWVSRRAPQRRALAAALYLCSYYLGGSLIGSASGLAWSRDGWAGVVGVLGLCIVAALAAAVYLRRAPRSTATGGAEPVGAASAAIGPPRRASG